MDSAATNSSSQQSFRTYNNPSENDTEEEFSQAQMDVQNSSLASSRRAMERLNLAEKTATSNLGKMSSQTEQLTRIETKLDQSAQKIKVSDAKADQLKSLNKWFFLPSFGGKKVSRVERESKAQDADMKLKIEQSRDRQANRSGEIERTASAMRHAQQGDRRGEYNTTPSGIQRCNVEREIDSNLGQMSQGLGRLKLMGQAMNEELVSQGGQIGRISEKTSYADERLKSSTRKVNAIKWEDYFVQYYYFVCVVYFLTTRHD